MTRWDRLLFAGPYRFQPSVLRSISIVRPGDRDPLAPAGIPALLEAQIPGQGRAAAGPGGATAPLIQEISVANPLWGAPRIHGELLKLGIEISQSTVAKYMIRGCHPPSQSWLTFLQSHADDIAALDLFVVPTLGFRLLFGLVILRHGRRQILHVGATYHPTAEWITRQVTEALPWETVPRYLLRDRDGAYGDIFRQRLSAMGIRDRSVAPKSAW